jgi:hypothetical protein
MEKMHAKSLPDLMRKAELLGLSEFIPGGHQAEHAHAAFVHSTADIDH